MLIVFLVAVGSSVVAAAVIGLFGLARRRYVSALQHGGYSPARIRAKARSEKRRFLERLGVRASELDAVTRERLNHWALGSAQLTLLTASGEAGRNYWTAYNGVYRALRELEARLHAVGLDGGSGRKSALERYLADGPRGLEE